MSAPHTRFGVARALGLLSLGLLWGCGQAGEEPAIESLETPVSAETRITPAVSVNAVMVAVIDHAGHVLWDAESKAPASDREWREIEHHAIQIATAGTAIALGGTGQADPGWAQLPDWKPLARNMTDAGMAALDAARSKNVEALVKANGRLVESCEQCHKAFKPELPSEGILHPH